MSGTSRLMHMPLQVKELGLGNFGVVRLWVDRSNGELVAVKLIKRGEKVDKNVEREILNHRLLHHPNIIGFKEVSKSDSHTHIFSFRVDSSCRH